jgi:hypothetical protein
MGVMDDQTSDMPAGEPFRRVGQSNMDDSNHQEDNNKNRTFHSSNSSSSSYSDYSSSNRSGVSKLLIIVLVVIVLGLIGGSVYLFRDRLPFGEADPSPSPSALQAPVAQDSTPAPTPESFDRTQYKIRVLNGTTTSGLAGSASAKLKELGYQIERTGNATNSAFEKTQVRVKADATDLLEQLIQDLSGDFAGEASTNLRDNDTADAEIILGAQ